MFKLSRSHLVSAIAMLYLTTSTSAGVIEARATDASVNVEVCTGPVGTGCVSIPVGSSTCTDLDGGLVFLNKEVTSSIVPGGFVCTFFENFGCVSMQNAGDDVVLTEGTWDFFSVPGTNEPTVDFNDLTSSFSCSPLS